MHANLLKFWKPESIDMRIVLNFCSRNFHSIKVKLKSHPHLLCDLER